ncbi:TPA: hypothetical protein JDH29_004208 [Salmonella enterica subsp. houtenae]|nr:hypothetical protein [Salmonella enterica subsp. houtenae]
MNLQITGNNMNGSPELSLSGGNSTIFAWSPFGGGATRTGNAASLPGFNGERQDPLSGVTHLGNGYRAYSPALRRFTCPDSESPFGEGGINPYVYCDHDPVNNTDPSGHMPIGGKPLNSYEMKMARRQAKGIPEQQIQAFPKAVVQPRGIAGAEGIAPEQVQQRAAPAEPVQGVAQQGARPRQRIQMPARDARPTSTSGLVNPSASNLVKPSPLVMIAAKADEDVEKAKRDMFVNYQSRRNNFELTVHNNKVCYQNAPLTTNKKGNFKFIQNESGKLYGVETMSNPSGIKHSSLLGKNWPISAGTIDAENGVITKITNASGHFHPGKVNLEYTKNFLVQSGVKVREVEVYPIPANSRRFAGTVSQYKGRLRRAV